MVSLMLLTQCIILTQPHVKAADVVSNIKIYFNAVHMLSCLVSMSRKANVLFTFYCKNCFQYIPGVWTLYIVVIHSSIQASMLFATLTL